MADIFISYARKDQARVKSLVRILERQGWTVFWDLDIPPGETWRSWIGRHLDEARCLIVAWSVNSIESHWVLEEADQAIRLQKPFFPLLLDTVLPPLGYRQIQAADFRDWEGKSEALVAVNLLQWLAQKLGSPHHAQEPFSTFRDPLRDSGEFLEMVVIPAGSFWMGSPYEEPERLETEGPHHRVAIPRPFALGRTTVTFDQYNRFVEATGGKQPSDRDWGRRPVINVSWGDAVAYAEWLSEQTSKRYRLPTEAEWEYACRAGTDTAFSTGDCLHTDQANYDGNHEYNDCGAKTGVYREKTVPTGSLPPNPWGLHEMHGNVWEWVQDCWHESYEGAPDDGSAWEEADDGDCSRRVARGGSWFLKPRALRSATRSRNYTGARTKYLGFRLAQDL